jgi:hypothetical protein
MGFVRAALVRCATVLARAGAIAARRELRGRRAAATIPRVLLALLVLRTADGPQ